MLGEQGGASPRAGARRVSWAGGFRSAELLSLINEV